MRRSRVDGKRDRIAIDVCCWQCTCQGSILIGHDARGRWARGVIYSRYRQVNPCDGFLALSIYDFVGERVRTIVVGSWRICERAIGFECDYSVRRRSDQRVGDRVAIRIYVVGDDRSSKRRIFVKRERVVARSWRGIGNCVSKCLGDRGTLAIGGRHRDRINSIRQRAAAGRTAAERAVNETRAAVDNKTCRHASCGEAQSIAVWIGEASASRNADRLGIYARRTGNRRTDWSGVDDIPSECLACNFAARISCSNRYGIRPGRGCKVINSA